MINRKEMYSKETYVLYMKYMMEYFGQTKIKFNYEDKKRKEDSRREASSN